MIDLTSVIGPEPEVITDEYMAKYYAALDEAGKGWPVLSEKEAADFDKKFFVCPECEGQEYWIEGGVEVVCSCVKGNRW